MTQKSNYRYLRVNIPTDDPRFQGLLDMIDLLNKRGRGSPVGRMLAEFCLDGYRLYMGQIASGSQNQASGASGAGGEIDLGDGRTVDPQARQQQRDQMRAALAQLPGTDLDL
jgi:hypothetical protein